MCYTCVSQDSLAAACVTFVGIVAGNVEIGGGGIFF
jgi:hypothetical protein